MINESIVNVNKAIINNIDEVTIKHNDNFFGLITDDKLINKISQYLAPVDILTGDNYNTIDLSEAISFEI